MRREEVHRILGAAETSFPIWDRSGFSEHYAGGNYNIGYTNDWVVNPLGFEPGVGELLIRGEMIWSLDHQPDPNLSFLALDPEPLEIVGFWIFQELGVTTTGYHDDDRSQLAVTVFERENWAELLSSATAADTTKYRRN